MLKRNLSVVLVRVDFGASHTFPNSSMRIQSSTSRALNESVSSGAIGMQPDSRWWG